MPGAAFWPPLAMQLVLHRSVLDLAQPKVMGVLNVTPDSFSDGGRYAGLDAAVARAERMVEEGAAIVDVGGESTRPGASPVSADEEIRRVVPVIERLTSRIAVPVSVDTSKPEVMRAAVDAGAQMINDVRALRVPGALAAAAASGVAVCLMHMQGEPDSMQAAPSYEDVIADVRSFLDARVAACLSAGIPRERICIDPGIGFGKLLEHNLALLAGLSRIGEPSLPIVVGVSRKSLVGIITGRPPADRLAGSVAFAALAVSRGARMVRAHDVAATVDAVKVAAALLSALQGDK
jgi:dihydropteroate synthase